MTNGGKTQYKTLRVPVDAWETAKEQKEAAGRTWGEQIVRPGGHPDKMLQVKNAHPSEQELAAIRGQLAQVPERTADELEGRFR